MVTEIKPGEISERMRDLIEYPEAEYFISSDEKKLLADTWQKVSNLKRDKDGVILWDETQPDLMKDLVMEGVEVRIPIREQHGK